MHSWGSTIVYFIKPKQSVAETEYTKAPESRCSLPQGAHTALGIGGRHSLKSHREAKTQGRTRPAEVCVSVLSSQIFAIGTSRKEQMVMEV